MQCCRYFIFISFFYLIFLLVSHPKPTNSIFVAWGIFIYVFAAWNVLARACASIGTPAYWCSRGRFIFRNFWFRILKYSRFGMSRDIILVCRSSFVLFVFEIVIVTLFRVLCLSIKSEIQVRKGEKMCLRFCFQSVIKVCVENCCSIVLRIVDSQSVSVAWRCMFCVTIAKSSARERSFRVLCSRYLRCHGFLRINHVFQCFLFIFFNF